jgi:thiamine pyrophosphokinase
MVILNGTGPCTKRLRLNWNDNIVILANGQFPSAQQALGLLRTAEIVICCDGAADKLIGFGMKPHIIVGDMDSISDETRKQYAFTLIMSGDQESNDLTKAVEYCIMKGYPSVTILGATGLREDHTLGNISLMMEYYPRIVVRMFSDFGIFFLVKSGEAVESNIGDKISIFSIDNTIRVTSRGLKYPLKDLQLSNWYRATLNEVVEERFTLQYESDIPLIVYRAW